MGARDGDAIAIIDEGLARLREGLAKLLTREEWVDQNHSPLGKSMHLKAVRRGDLVGRKVGHQVLVKRTELDAYIEKHRVRVKPPANDTGDESEDEAVRRVLDEAERIATKPARRRRA